MKGLKERVTLLVLPAAGRPSWRLSVAPGTVAAALILWSLGAAAAGIWAGSRLDLWSAKAEAQLVRREVEQSRDEIARVRHADRELRAMLRAPDGSSVYSSTSSGSGGPLASELRETLKSYAELSSLIDRRRAVLRVTPQGWPTAGRLTSIYGRRRSPISGPEARSSEFHPGLDIANSQGTPILATADGVVRRAGWARGYGRMLLIRHSARFATLFGHTSRLLVKEGQRVERGQAVALMGTTGRSTGSHLHYEIWLDGRPVNPRRYLKSGL